MRAPTHTHAHKPTSRNKTAVLVDRANSLECIQTTTRSRPTPPAIGPPSGSPPDPPAAAATAAAAAATTRPLSTAATRHVWQPPSTEALNEPKPNFPDRPCRLLRTQNQPRRVTAGTGLRVPRVPAPLKPPFPLDRLGYSPDPFAPYPACLHTEGPEVVGCARCPRRLGRC